jgi:SAM-dependent methyltransferase
MDLTAYRGGESERKRIADLMRLLPGSLDSVLDVGARDGFISKLLARHFPNVTALDLEEPRIDDERIRCVKGDVTGLNFPDAYFDLVFCAEVIEHMPGRSLDRACGELSRVAREYLLIGVPYKQDLRVGRLTCQACGKKNPPWGHVNSFDEDSLKELFPEFEVDGLSFVGEVDAWTNPFSTFLMDLAGNPYGSYSQEELCVYCGAKFRSPPERNLSQKALTKIACYLNAAQKAFRMPRPNWIHVLFKKRLATE